MGLQADTDVVHHRLQGNGAKLTVNLALNTSGDVERLIFTFTNVFSLT